MKIFALILATLITTTCLANLDNTEQEERIQYASCKATTFYVTQDPRYKVIVFESKDEVTCAILRNSRVETEVFFYDDDSYILTTNKGILEDI